MKRLLALSLLSVMLIQSCAVYDIGPMSLAEASGQGKAKVITEYGEKFRYDFIMLSDSSYWGVSRNSQEQLQPDEITSVYLQSAKQSFSKAEKIGGGIVLGIIIGGLVIGIVYVTMLLHELNTL